MASLKDIATSAGVSVSVVSRVLNNRMGNTRVRPQVAARIRARAIELGYRPNPSALALSSGRQNVLGVFIHSVGHASSGITENMLEGISVAARRLHQRLITTFYCSAEEFHQWSPDARPDMMDGLLMAGRAHCEFVPRLLAIRKAGVPVVTLHHSELHPALPNAGVDQREAGRLATAHLIERGCRRIVHIRNFAERYDGYRDALAEAGLPLLATLVVRHKRDDLGHEIGEAVVRRMVKSGVAFDGLVAQSDAQALGALNALAEAGITVPQQVRVIGMDNSHHCEMARVPLSSVGQKYIERGECAVDMLLDMIQGRDVSSIVKMPILRARASTQ